MLKARDCVQAAPYNSDQDQFCAGKECGKSLAFDLLWSKV